MKRVETPLPGVCILEPKVHRDGRGFFLEAYNQRLFVELGITCPFVQDNHSRSTRGVVRGLHYQLDQPQDKLVRVIAGEVYDVAVDVRRGSPTFGKHVGVMLSAENMRMLFVPKGFAHGFCVTSDSAEFLYKCSDFYSPASERGVLWCDDELGIDWPLGGAEPVLSDKDRAYKTLRLQPEADLPVYQGDGS